MTLDFIKKHIAEFECIITALGGGWKKPVIKGPATESELAAIEKKLGRSIPSTLRQFAATVSQKIFFEWELPEHLELTGQLYVLSGGIDFDVSKLPKHEQSKQDWQETFLPELQDPKDSFWHDKLAIIDYAVGYLSVDSDGAVINLSMVDMGGHGCVLARSFTELMEKWLPIGCPGPDELQWLPFVEDSSTGINPDGDIAKQWMREIRTVGIKASNQALKVKLTNKPIKKWEHAELGTFKLDEWDWIQKREFEGFNKLFPKSKERIHLRLVTFDYTTTPPDTPIFPRDDLASLAQKVVINLESLIEAGITALWKDFHGEGDHSSGMWWHNSFAEVFESDYEEDWPKSEKELISLIEPAGVDVLSSIDDWEGPVAQISFYAEFEDEHGISFLTDGEKIIGLGYMGEAIPFEGLSNPK